MFFSINMSLNENVKKGNQNITIYLNWSLEIDSENYVQVIGSITKVNNKSKTAHDEHYFIVSNCKKN